MASHAPGIASAFPPSAAAFGATGPTTVGTSPAGVISVSSCLAQAKSPGEDGVLVPAAPAAPQLFGVVDGHGGAEVTLRIVSRLPALVAAEVAKDASSGAAALSRGVARCEADLLDEEALAEQGACAVFLLVTPGGPGAPASAAVASVGDCVAVAACVFEGALLPKRLSGAPHNLSTGLELFKAMRVGVAVELDDADEDDPALFCKSPFLHPDEGGLQCTRSLGDSGFKRPAAALGGAGRKRKSVGARPPLSATPHEASTLVSDTAFVVLASDGVSDHLADGELVAAVAAHVAAGGRREDAAAALVRAAMQRAAFAARPQRLATDVLAAMPCGEDRRDVCDDMAAVVVFFR